MHRTLVLVVFSCVTVVAVNPAAQNAGNAAMFERMRGLVGEWEGTFEWSGGRDGHGTLKATYYLTGQSTALVENLVMAGRTAMTTVYHRDGSDLRMTHFCAAGNQPRLKSSHVSERDGVIEFGFVDVTNVTPGRGGYVQRSRMELLGPNRLNLTFVFGSSTGPTATEKIYLRRVN